MNKYILFVIDNQVNPGKYTLAQIEANRKAAYLARSAAYSDYLETYTPDAAATYASAVDADAASAVCVACSSYLGSYASTTTTYWINLYFDRSGEDRQDYINAIEGSQL